MDTADCDIGSPAPIVAGAAMTDADDPAEDPDGDPQRDARAIALRTGRMEAFSDGVFAIAITLLVLEIQIPPDRGDHLLRAVIEEWPSYIAYLVSFFTIGGVWIAHSVITESLDRVDPFFLRLNLILLLVVGFLPVPTGLAAEYLRSTDGERVAATLYGLTLLGIRLMIMVLWRYGLSRRLLRPDMSDEDVEGLTQKLTPSLAAYAAAIGIGLAVPTVAVALYLAIALYLVIDFRSAVRAVRRSGSP